MCMDVTSEVPNVSAICFCFLCCVVRAGELCGCEQPLRQLPPQKASEDLVSGVESGSPGSRQCSLIFLVWMRAFGRLFFHSQGSTLMQWLLFSPPRLFLWGRGSDQVSQSLGGAQEHIQHGQAGHLTQECGPGEVSSGLPQGQDSVEC